MNPLKFRKAQIVSVGLGILSNNFVNINGNMSIEVGGK